MLSRISNWRKYLIRLIALMPVAIFLEISLIWHSQERFLSMWTPRDFKVETCLIGNLLIMKFLSSVDSLCLDPFNKNSVLVVFSVSLFAASHMWILSKSMLTQRSISSTSLLRYSKGAGKTKKGKIKKTLIEVIPSQQEWKRQRRIELKTSLEKGFCVVSLQWNRREQCFASIV